MRQTTSLERKQRVESLVDSPGLMWLRDRLYPLLMILCKTKVTYKLKCSDPLNVLPDRPIIFAANHSAFPDMPIVLRITGHQSYVFAGTQRLAPEDMRASKETLIAYLKKGRSILWFPEGTWNLTENLLMLPLKWGIIDIALATEAQIIPLALEYDNEKMICSVRIGIPFLPPDDKKQGINDLRDVLATLRWELWEQKEILRRKELNIEECRKELMQPVLDYPPLQWEKEQKAIFNPYTTPKDVFSFIEKLIPSSKNAFLFHRWQN